MRFKQYLTEKRSHPELNPKVDNWNILQQYVNKPGYVFSMTVIPRLGINPQYDFDTPLGVYFYILNDYNVSHLKNDKTFGMERDYLHVAKVDMSKVLNIQKYTDSDFDKDYKILYKLYFNKIVVPPTFRDTAWGDILSNSDIVFDYVKYTAHPNSQPGTSIFYLANNIARKLKKDKSASLWEHILRVDLGYWGVWDDGSGTIHPSEKSQFVAFNPNVYKEIDIIDNPAIITKNKFYIDSIDDIIKEPMVSYINNIFDVIRKNKDKRFIDYNDKEEGKTITINKESLLKSITYKNMKKFMTSFAKILITFSNFYDILLFSKEVLTDKQIFDIMDLFLDETLEHRGYKTVNQLSEFIRQQKQGILPKDLEKYFDPIMEKWRKKLIKREKMDSV
jgi:hypothetical protein